MLPHLHSILFVSGLSVWLIIWCTWAASLSKILLCFFVFFFSPFFSPPPNWNANAVRIVKKRKRCQVKYFKGIRSSFKASRGCTTMIVSSSSKGWLSGLRSTSNMWCRCLYFWLYKTSSCLLCPCGITRLNRDHAILSIWKNLLCVWLNSKSLLNQQWHCSVLSLGN